jgi:hypothetical protein
MLRLRNNLWALALLLGACATEDGPTTGTRDELYGPWLVNESSAAGPQAYTVTISQGPGTNDVLISNFHNEGAGAVARMELVTNTAVSIPEQWLPGNIRITGNGAITSNYGQINLSYSVDDGTGAEQIQSVMVR